MAACPDTPNMSRQNLILYNMRANLVRRENGVNLKHLKGSFSFFKKRFYAVGLEWGALARFETALITRGKGTSKAHRRQRRLCLSNLQPNDRISRG